MSGVPLSFAALLSTGLLTLLPHLGEARADRVGEAIFATVGEDIDAAALMMVTGGQESGFSEDVCSCRVVGEGDVLGCYQMDPTIWGRACGDLEAQTARAFRVLQIVGWPERGPTRTLQRYAGARSVEHPEVRERAALFVVTRARLEARACL